MSGRRMPNCPASASKGFSSTPVKTRQGQVCHTSKGLDDGVLSDDEDTFSLLSPIYHDSFDSDEDLEHSPAQQTSPRQSGSVSPIRCELPRTPSEQMLNAAVQPAGSPTLSAWEMWLVNKAKEDRLKQEKKAEEEQLLKEKKEQQEREQEHKKVVMQEKIQEWLNMKREQEEAALKAEQEKERRRRAEEKFKEWLAKANEKSRASPRSPNYPTSPYDKSYPSPSFYNPIPWKPIHVPPPEPSPNKTSAKKPQRNRKCQQSPSTAFRLRNSASAGPLLHRR
ncbi:Coiled-coil domain-containing protein 34 [Nibea albiflora]|uniref:Coiled-coil domain-containing protein 34 n=1 Tax=Nibea albiflora TaxID=240163 RepID=A0ACB7FDL3_NIBAL|nr:Coiled-coil domain-containing protein 34 [Nibea albiflora]